MNKYDDAVWKLAASLILMKPKMDERQLFTLTRAPVILFHPDAMRTIVECWNWLLSARPDLELVFLQVSFPQIWNSFIDSSILKGAKLTRSASTYVLSLFLPCLESSEQKAPVQGKNKHISESRLSGPKSATKFWSFLVLTYRALVSRVTSDASMPLHFEGNFWFVKF